MIDKEHFMPLNFFQKADYKGSLSGLRYRIGKAVVPVAQEEPAKSAKESKETIASVVQEEPAQGAKEGGEVTVLRAVIWEGPFSYEKRDPATEYGKDFPFSADGIGEAVDWINGEYERGRERWDNVPFWTPAMSRRWEEEA